MIGKMDSYLAILQLTWMITTILVAQASASGSFQVQLLSFSNPERQTDAGQCCPGSRNAPSPPTAPSPTPNPTHTPHRCSQPCRTYFRFCFSHYQTSIPDDPVCTYGNQTTPVLTTTDSFPSTLDQLDRSGGGMTTENITDIPPTSTESSSVTFSFSFTWPGTFTLIVDAFHEEEDRTGAQANSDSQPHRRLARVSVQRSLGPDNEWHSLIQSNGSVRISLRYRVSCSEHYYGRGCSEICKPRDDKFGHYRCSDAGTKSCLSGWSGQYCDKAVCLPGCSSKSGFCEEPNECRCRLGWQGPTCTSCIQYPGCQHGTCNKPWECQCQEGWGGLFCNQDLNFCTNHRPCRNGATCINTGQGSYTCVCPPGYTGTICEMEANDCRPTNRTCINKGVCTEMAANEFVCQCPTGLYGRRCELKLASGCEGGPCLNSGTCISIPGGVDQEYRCTCPKGFTGVNCEQQMDECRSQPCQNGGSCINELNGGFRCVCQPGYRGDRCQDNHNECSVNPCLNSGVCIDKVDDFECRCQPGFVGSLCQDDVDECLNFPCANGAACRDLPRGFQCTCTAGFTGKFCTIKVDTCMSRPCLHGATCRPGVDSYECQCVAGYHGMNCEFIVAKGGKEGGAVIPPTSMSDSTVSGVTQLHDRSRGEVTESVAINGSSNVQSLVNHFGSQLTTQQWLLIVCVGVGLPVILILCAALFFVLRRHRRDVKTQRQQLSSERQNEENNDQAKRLNNKTIAMELDSVEDIPDNSSIYLGLIDSKLNQRNLNSDTGGGGGSGGGGGGGKSGGGGGVVSQQHSLNVHRNYARKQNNLRRLKDVNIDFGV